MESPNAASLSAQMRELGSEQLDIVRVYRTFNAASEPFRKESEAHERD
jgi:hypothetical protein